MKGCGGGDRWWFTGTCGADDWFQESMVHGENV
jgi:hypothetical protein